MDVRRDFFLHLLRIATMSFVLPGLVLLQGPFSQAQSPETEVSSVLSLKWPNGVDLLAAQNLSLPTGEYFWRASSQIASTTPGEPIETARGFVIAVSGEMMVQINGTNIIRLAPGGAVAVPEDGEIATVSATGADVDYLLLELFTEEDSEQVADDDGIMEVVGPIEVAGGEYGLVLLNLPIAVTIDISADDVIFGSLRPAISIAHIDNAIPEDVNPDRKYDRWIGALFPIGDVVTTTPPPAAETVPQAPVVQSPAPTAPNVPTEPAPTAPIVPTEPVATSEPTVTVQPTEEPTTVPATEVPIPTDEPALPTVPPVPTVPSVPTLPPMPTIPPLPTIPPVPTVSV